MSFPLHLSLPLISSWLYVAAVLLMKRAADFGVGAWRTTFVANLVTFLVFLPLLGLGGKDQPGQAWWQPIITAVLMLAGQSLTFLALERGDVSIATPVMGIKIVLVALLTTLILATPVPLAIWVAAALSTLAIALLNWGGGGFQQRTGQTILLSAGAALSFALFDVLIQKWTPLWGVGRFLPATFAIVALLSLGLIPLFPASLKTLSPQAWRWLGGGSLLMALQALVLIVALGVYGDATSINVVYATRGVWSVVAVWLVGHWFQNAEQQLGKHVLKYHLAGAGLIFVALLLVLQ